jgi:hypothetical protein
MLSQAQSADATNFYARWLLVSLSIIKKAFLKQEGFFIIAIPTINRAFLGCVLMLLQ